MANFAKIIYPKLRQAVMLFSGYSEATRKGKIAYSSKQWERYRNKIISYFKSYIKKRSKELGDIGEKYGLTKKDITQIFKYAERNIISTFNANVERAFGQAMHSIEKALGEQETASGFFGIYGLMKYFGVRQKLEGKNKIEGLTRMTKKGNLFSINIIDYLLLLIRTAQMEWERKVGEAIAWNTGNDLVRISPHPCWLGPKADEVCNRWRDRIVSLTGSTANFPPLKLATSEKPPLFHPNCTHKIIPLTLVEQRKAIAMKIKTYTTLRKYI